MRGMSKEIIKNYLTITYKDLTMNYSYKIPPVSIAEYVKSILVIENFKIVNPFTLPLFANGCPTLVFSNKKSLA